MLSYYKHFTKSWVFLSITSLPASRTKKRTPIMLHVKTTYWATTLRHDCKTHYIISCFTTSRHVFSPLGGVFLFSRSGSNDQYCFPVNGLFFSRNKTKYNKTLRLYVCCNLRLATLGLSVGSRTCDHLGKPTEAKLDGRTLSLHCFILLISNACFISTFNDH